MTHPIDERRRKPTEDLTFDHMLGEVDPNQHDKSARAQDDVKLPRHPYVNHEEPAIVEEFVIQEISIDAICGVY